MSNMPFLVRLRFFLQAGFDALCCFVALHLAALLRLDFDLAQLKFAPLFFGGLVAAAGQVAIGRFVGLYIHRWRYGTFEEVGGATISVSIVTAVGTIGNAILGHHLPITVPLLAGPFAYFGMVGGRAV